VACRDQPISAARKVAEISFQTSYAGSIPVARSAGTSGDAAEHPFDGSRGPVSVPFAGASASSPSLLLVL